MASNKVKIIDLRSDTFSLPTKEMRKVIYEAEVGDDVFNEDPTVNALEERCAKLFEKEAALYVPTGTLGNLISLLVHCDERASEIITGHMSHINLFEQTGAAQFGGINVKIIKNNDDGTFDLDELNDVIRVGTIHEPITKAICVENTHNVLGGKVLPLDWIDQLAEFANTRKIPLHMDGARIFNASVALGVPVSRIAKDFDSVTFCFSKGLGAPFGAAIVGRTDFIRKARKLRKGLGAGTRQIGFMAAASNYALDHLDHLKDDHYHTKKIAKAIRELKNPFIIAPEDEDIHSNILIIKVDNKKLTSDDLVERLKTVNEKDQNSVCVKTLPFGPQKLRITLCINNVPSEVDEAIIKIKSVINEIR